MDISFSFSLVMGTWCNCLLQWSV